MSVILEALKRVQKARTDKIERDREFKITTILSPVDVARKRRLFLSLSLVGIGGGLIFFLVFAVVSPKMALREEARYSGRENLEAPRRVRSDNDREQGTKIGVELQKPEPPKRQLELKKYVKISPPPGESIEKPDAKKDRPPKQIPIELNPPKSAIYHFNIGVFYQGEGKLKEAKEEYEKALSLDPLNVEAHNNLGAVYKDLGKLDMEIGRAHV